MIELHYFHPVFNQWLIRIGAGSVQIRIKKDTDFTDLKNKIQNALTMDYPHLKSGCFRNAVSSIGKLFGRDLARKLEDKYYGFYAEGIPNEKTEIIDKTKYISDAQIKRLFAIMNDKIKSLKLIKEDFYDEVKEYMIREFNVEHRANLTPTQYQNICDWIENYKRIEIKPEDL